MSVMLKRRASVVCLHDSEGVGTKGLKKRIEALRFRQFAGISIVGGKIVWGLCTDVKILEKWDGRG